MIKIDVGLKNIISANYGKNSRKGKNVLEILKKNLNKKITINDFFFGVESENTFKLFITIKDEIITIDNNECVYFKDIFYQFEEYIKDKRIIIVGPSESLYKQKNGEFIDSFDIVCRIKKSYPLDKSKLEYTGERTDILLSHLKLGNKKYKQNNFDEHPADEYNKLKYIFFPYPRVKHFDRFYSNFKKSFKSIKTQVIYPRGSKKYNKVNNILNNHDPKIGLMSILSLLDYDIKELYITGLTFQQDGFVNTYKTKDQEIFCNERTKNVHDSNLELEYFVKNIAYHRKISLDNTLNKIVIGKSKCIFTACTENYLDRAISLYNSINKYNKDIIFYVILINISKDNFFENNKSNKLVIKYDNINLPKDKIAAYSACLRASIFPKLNMYKYVFWMDADTIIRGNLNDLFNILNKNDMTIHYKPKNIEKQGAYKTGIIGVKISNKIMNFLNDWDNILFSDGKDKCVWYDDQKTITNVIEKHQNLIKINHLDRKYIDWKFNEKSIIWVGKGDRKNSELYLKEESKYK